MLITTVSEMKKAIIFSFCILSLGQVFKLTDNVHLGSRDPNATYERTVPKSTPCSRWNTCAYSKSVYIPNCYCDELCHLYNDCCIDYESHSFDGSKMETGGEEDTGLGNVDISNLECKILYARNIGVNMVTSCPDSYRRKGDGIFQKSTNEAFQNEIVVTGSDGKVYANKHTALCNNVTKFENWNINFDLQFCFDNIDMRNVLKPSVEDIALHYYELGCLFQVIPPRDVLPRFCISFEHCDNASGEIRLPIINIEGTFFNEECCKLHSATGRCGKCHTSGLTTYDKLNARFGTAMVAMIQFKGATEKQDNGKDVRKSNSTIRLRNAIIRQLCIASVEGEIGIPIWTRAFMFYKLLIEKALEKFEVIFSYVHSFSFLTNKESNKTKVYGNTYLQFKKDLKSYNTYLEIETWLFGSTVSYVEYSERSSVFNISIMPIGQAEDVCAFTNHTCKALPAYGNVNNNEFYEAFDRIEMSNLYPNRNCETVLGIMKRKGTQGTLIIDCTRIESLESKGSLLKSDLRLAKVLSLCIFVIKLLEFILRVLKSYLP